MYAKVFRQFFESTINEEPLHVRLLFIFMLMQANDDGVVDATPQSLARSFNMPLDQVTEGLARLCAPDPSSRSREEEGRRLIPIRATYGWRIVNYIAYRNIQREEDRRTYHREYGRKRRALRRKATGSRVNNRQQASTESIQEEEEERGKRKKADEDERGRGNEIANKTATTRAREQFLP